MVTKSSTQSMKRQILCVVREVIKLRGIGACEGRGAVVDGRARNVGVLLDRGRVAAKHYDVKLHLHVGVNCTGCHHRTRVGGA